MLLIDANPLSLGLDLGGVTQVVIVRNSTIPTRVLQRTRNASSQAVPYSVRTTIVEGERRLTVLRSQG